MLLELTAAADRATIASHVAALEARGGTCLYPALEDAGGRAVEIPVTQAALGLFEGVAGPIRYGDDQQFLWRARPAGREEQVVSYGFVASFSPEFATLGFCAQTADQSRSHTAGSVMSLDAATLELNDDSRDCWIALAPALLIAAIALIPFDILVRRLG